MHREIWEVRISRERGESGTADGYVLAIEPNANNYAFGVGDNRYMERFDREEIKEAFQAAEQYVKETLMMDSPLYACADPRMTAIYEDEDKGVADGYDADSLFLCEYLDGETWRYLILAREEKGAAWSVLYCGDTYQSGL